jgi:hypothetical protein
MSVVVRITARDFTVFESVNYGVYVSLRGVCGDYWGRTLDDAISNAEKCICIPATEIYKLN